jgi:hypothetical protein
MMFFQNPFIYHCFYFFKKKNCQKIWLKSPLGFATISHYRTLKPLIPIKLVTLLGLYPTPKPNVLDNLTQHQWFYWRIFVCNQCSGPPKEDVEKKWQSSLGRFSQIWLLTKYEIYIFNYPFIFLAICWKPNIEIWPKKISIMAIENLQKCDKALDGPLG